MQKVLMSAAAAAAPTEDVLPKEDSLYFDYLASFPVGVSMAMELQPDAAALKEDETAQMIFTIKKVGADAWEGLPGYKAEDGTVKRTPAHSSTTWSSRWRESTTSKWRTAKILAESNAR